MTDNKEQQENYMSREQLPDDNSQTYHPSIGQPEKQIRCEDCGLELSEENESHDCDIYSTVMQYRKDHPEPERQGEEGFEQFVITQMNESYNGYAGTNEAILDAAHYINAKHQSELSAAKQKIEELEEKLEGSRIIWQDPDHEDIKITEEDCTQWWFEESEHFKLQYREALGKIKALESQHATIASDTWDACILAVKRNVLVDEQNKTVVIDPGKEKEKYMERFNNLKNIS